MELILPIPPLYQIKEIIENESRCLEYLQDLSVLPRTMTCLYCNNPNMNLEIKTLTFNCGKRNCRKRISIFNGTIFSNAKLNCNQIMELSYFWLSKATRKQLKTYTNITPANITRWTQTFRTIVTQEIQMCETKIGGPDIIVEIDESLFYKNRQNKSEQLWVFGGIERTPEKQIFATICKDRTADTLLNLIQKYVHPNSIIYSDMFKSYDQIFTRLGIRHHQINHSQGMRMIDFDETSNELKIYHTNNIEATWHVLKDSIPKRNQNKKDLPKHLMEQIWRRQNKQRLWNAYIECLQNKYEDIIELIENYETE